MDFRDIAQASGINVYMYGWLFIQMEQFIDLDWYFWLGCACSLAVVFLVSLALGISWLGAALVAGFAIAQWCAAMRALGKRDSTRISHPVVRGSTSGAT